MSTGRDEQNQGDTRPREAMVVKDADFMARVSGFRWLAILQLPDKHLTKLQYNWNIQPLLELVKLNRHRYVFGSTDLKSLVSQDIAQQWPFSEAWATVSSAAPQPQQDKLTHRRLRNLSGSQRRSGKHKIVA